MAVSNQGFGRRLYDVANVYPTVVSADGRPDWKAGGITIDTTLLAAAVSGSDVTLPDGSVIPIGYQYLRYGTVMVQLTSGGSSGKYAPYSSSGSNGQQTMTRGKCFVLNETWVLNPAAGAIANSGDIIIGNVFDGGLVYKDRLNVDDPGSTATTPDIADFLTAFPSIRFVTEANT